jgi:SAM-dependent methyltransferase
MTIHQKLYQSADLYDLAFSYRDFEAEAKFLRDIYTLRRGNAPRSFLELAAGPARHALEMSKSGLNATGLDLVPEMAARGFALANARGVPLEYVVADMTNFALAAPVDLAACLLISATYLTTDVAFLDHLRCVYTALTPGGMYVLELPLHCDDMVHPETQHQPCREWLMQDAHGTLSATWREEPRAPGSLTHTATAKLAYQPVAGSTVELEEQATQREYRARDVVHLAEQAQFQVAGIWGDWDTGVALTNPDAWRLLVALERAAER